MKLSSVTTRLLQRNALDAVYNRCREGGVEIVHEIGDRYYGLRDFVISDLNGFRLRFASPLA